MNNNRSNNRRRGRGNNRGSGGGHQANRIDSRARGNAPQLLEKYKKLAHDASLNGDRVQTEYYLQFADHYFRVIADGKAQKDETRGRRDADRDQSSDDEDDYEDEDRQDPRGQRDSRGSRRSRDEDSAPEEGQRGSEGDEESEEDENVFAREARPRSQRPARRRGKPAAETSDEGGQGEFDASILPPSIPRDERDGQGDEEKPAAKPKATRRRTRKKADESGDDEALEAVS